MSITFIVLMLMISSITYILSRYMLTVALRKHMLDIPNARSSHHIPTPRGGGAAFVSIIIAVCLGSCFAGLLPCPVAISIAVAGGSVALAGWIDDKQGVPILTRLFVHIIAALWIAAWIATAKTLNLGFADIPWGHFGLLFFALGAIWLINLYNFMDGIDGLAAAEAITAGLGGYILLRGTPGDLLALVTAMAVLGFIPWNWPQARLFMGDVGSGFLGLVFACLWMGSGNTPEGFFIWPILLGVFIVDATLTLLGRMYRREKWYASHRSHAYQAAAMRWGHAATTKTVILINVFWLTPCAAVCKLYPAWAAVIAVVAYLPLIAIYVKIKQQCVSSDSTNPQ